MKYEVFWKNPGYVVRPELKEDISCDYLIVGGGVTGVSMAYFLAKLGAKNIVLIEKHHIASGATGKAAGTLVLRGEVDLMDLNQSKGREETAKQWRRLHEDLKLIKKVVDDENIDCEAEPQDTLYCTIKGRSKEYLRQEYEAEKNVETTTKFLEGDDLKKEVNTDLFSQGILSANHGFSINPLKLTQNLSKVAEKYGVKIYENTAYLGEKNNIAKTYHGCINYKKIILAIDVDYPSEKIKNNKSTIVVTEQLTGAQLAKTGLEKKKIIFDDEENNNYYYLKAAQDNRLLLGFGNIIVHKKYKKTDPHFPHLKNIENFLKQLFPYLEVKPEYAWAGTFGITDNYEPLIKYENNKVVIAGAGSQVVCFMTAKEVATNLVANGL